MNTVKFAEQMNREQESGLKGWIEDSISKLSQSNTVSSLFDSSIFSGSKYSDAGGEERPKYKGKAQNSRLFDQSQFTPSNKEKPRDYYLKQEPSQRLSKLQIFNSDVSREGSITSSVYSVAQSSAILETPDSKTNNEEAEKIIEKYKVAKEKQKKYKKEIKILKMEKRKLIIKNRELTVEREVSNLYIQKV